MSYENAVPKPLKFLISDGKMIDDAGNVIAESETLKDLYTKWNPEAKKYLLSDGSVVDENNNLIIKNDYYKKMYDQATPKVAKYLHSDGTVDENPGSGSADLEDNHQTTIDVSTYTQPIEVLPTSGKDGMKKNTVTLTNIPSGGSATAYAWTYQGNGSVTYFNFDKSPQDVAALSESYVLGANIQDGKLMKIGVSHPIHLVGIRRTSDTEFTMAVSQGGPIVQELTYIRDTTKDFTLW